MESEIKKIFYALLVIGVLFVSSTIVFADEEVFEGADIMVIIDQSDSMNWNDPRREILDGVYHLLRLSLDTPNRIGFVVYNDTIVTYRPVVTIESEEQIDEIMTHLREINVARGTDVGLALHTARRQLLLDEYRSGQTAMLFLSDGWYGFSLFNPNRTNDDVLVDVEEVLGMITYPIHTVLYNVRNADEPSLKDDWSERTGGLGFNTENPLQLVAAIDEIFESIVEMATVTAVNAQIEYEMSQMHTHQLIIKNPTNETHRATVVEITLQNEDRFYQMMPIEMDNVEFRIYDEFVRITIHEPILPSYVFYYEAYGAEILDFQVTQQMVEIPTPIEINWPIVGVSFAGVTVVSGFILFIVILIKRHNVKRRFPKLHGTLECYFMVVPPNTKEIPIQSWSSTYIASHRKVNLDKLFRHISLRHKMPETERTFIEINDDNTLSIVNKAGVISYRNGAQFTDKRITLQHGQSVYMIFKKGSIEIELRFRKGSMS